jgi:hypothetical protein
MSDFVAQCRREWKRLGVADPVAKEMAAELASDLAEAKADGLSADELLGSSASDPRSFAASWAAERGAIPAQPSKPNVRRRPLTVIAFTLLAAIPVVVVVLQLLQSGPAAAPLGTEQPPHTVSPPPGFHLPSNPGQPTNTSAPVDLIVLSLAILALALAAWLWSNRRRSRPPTATA